jgi:hypothetical protein
MVRLFSVTRLLKSVIRHNRLEMLLFIHVGKWSWNGSPTQQRVTISLGQWEAKVIPCANWWVTSKMKVIGYGLGNLQFDNQLGHWDTHSSQLCNKEQALVGGFFHTLGELVRVSLRGVNLAKSTSPASCLPLQAGNIAKMFEITRGTLQHAPATKFASPDNFVVHVEHQIRCCLHTREGNNRHCKIEMVQM